MPVAVPTLAEIVAEPTRAEGLSGRLLCDLLIELGGIERLLTLRMLKVGVEPIPIQAEDRLLSIEEAAGVVGLAPGTFYRYLRKPPWKAAAVILSKTCVRVSAQRLQDVMHGGARRRVTRSISAHGETASLAPLHLNPANLSGGSPHANE